MITTSTRAEALDALSHAHSILFMSYLLGRGAVADALIKAAKAGATVTVRLEGKPLRNAALARMNRRTLAVLKKAGAHVSLADRNGRGPALHIKALVCDRVAYLDDRNWTAGGDAIMRDDAASHVAALAQAARGRTVRAANFWTSKHAGLQAETRLLEDATHARTVEVESENFGYSPQAYAALQRLARAHVRCKLLVSSDLNARGKAALARLAAEGVEVRAGTANEKVAVVDGRRAWVGSANATEGPDQIDWSLRTRRAALVRDLQRHFETNWSKAKPLKAE